MNLLNVDFKQSNIKSSTVKRDIIDARPIKSDGLIKPSRPAKSYLVNDPIYKAPVNFVEDICENLTNIKNGLKGKSNDHDLGRINDFAMKAGALGLAGYLFTRAKTPTSKVMEFLGFGSFFASMALWPKLFIEWPVRAMYGTNFNQKYVDNEGRKKRFSQDPQFKPWDLYTPEQISKMGDRLGVPKNIHNRNEVIKAKADKIHLQSNTLWMLTAGFATPIMSGLICNRAEKYLGPIIEKVRVSKKADKAKKDAAIQNIIVREDGKLEINVKYSDALDKIFDDPKKASISAEEFDELVNILNHNNDLYGKHAIKAQLLSILPKNPDLIDKSYADVLFGAVEKNNALAREGKPSLGHIDLKGLNKEEVEAFFDGRDLTLADVKKRIKSLYREKRMRLTYEYMEKLDDLLDIAKVLYNDPKNTIDEASIIDASRLAPKPITYKINPEIVNKIQNLDRVLVSFSKELESLGAYSKVLLNSEAESVAANRWNNTTKAFLEVLDIKGKDLIVSKGSGELVSEIITKKLEEIVKDEKSYEKAVKKVRDAILEFDRVFLPDANGKQQGKIVELKDGYDKLFDKYKRIIKTDMGFADIFDRLYGENESGTAGSLKNAAKSSIERRVFELRTGMYKILHTMDIFKRIQDKTMRKEFEDNARKHNLNWNERVEQVFTDIEEKDIPLLSKGDRTKEILSDLKTRYGYSEKVLQKAYQEGNIIETISRFDSFPSKITEIVGYTYDDFCNKIKKYVLDATTSDHTTKLGMANRTSAYDVFMRMMYSANLSPETERALKGIQLGSTDFVSSFKDYVHQSLLQIGKKVYPHSPEAIIDGFEMPRGPVDYLSFDMSVGPKISNIVREAAEKKFNSGVWLKRFGGGFAALVGITLLAETFFGKLNKQEVYVKKG